MSSRIMGLFSSIKPEDRGIRIIQNPGYRKDLTQTIIDFFVSAYYSIIMFDRTPLTRWSQKLPQGIVVDSKKFEAFLEKEVDPENVQNGQKNFSKLLEMISGTEKNLSLPS